MKIDINKVEDLEDLVTVSRAAIGRRDLNRDCTRVKGVFYHDHWNGRFKNTYRWGVRFLKKNVGRPWSIVYSELCEKIKNDKDILSQYGWESTKESICQYVDINNKRRKYRRNDCYCEDFYVDEHGILRTNLKDEPAHHRDRVEVKKMIGYRLRDSFLPWKAELMGHLYRNCRRNLVDAFNSGKVISIDVYNELKSSWAYLSYYEGIKNILKHAYVKDHPWCNPNSAYCTYRSFDDMFEPAYDVSTIIITKNQRIKRTAESDDHHRAIKRADERSKSKDLDTLLHRILHERKAQERALDALKIQAHGMDEKTSFRGEEYHGQKRKKKTK